ncbi:unnamed protein product, partial [Brenthis ino]
MLLTPGDVRDASHSCRVTRRRSARDADCQPATEESSPALRPRVATCAVTEPINVNQTNFAGNITRVRNYIIMKFIHSGQLKKNLLKVSKDKMELSQDRSSSRLSITVFCLINLENIDIWYLFSCLRDPMTETSIV